MDALKELNGKWPKIESEALALLKRLVACDTVDGNERNGQGIVEEWLGSLGFDVTRLTPDPEKLGANPLFNTGHAYSDRYCVIGSLKGGGGGNSLILNAHMDTVPPASPELWETDPFTPTEKDGALYGLGASDTKGGMAAMLAALKAVRSLGVTLGGDLQFHSVVDEEAGGGNGSLACLDAGYTADAALIAEPNGLCPASAHIGSYALRIKVEGKSTHANIKWRGVSAFEKALPLINRLTQLEQEWSRRKHDLLPSPVISVVEVKAGDGGITLPGGCELLVNYTYLPDGYDYYADISGIIEECQKADPWFAEHPIKVERHHDCGPYYTNPNEAWPRTVSAALAGVTGAPSPIVGLPCGADARLYANFGRMPTVVLGPGEITDCHKPNEFLPLGEFYKAIRIYAAIILEWCSYRRQEE